jgi:hypothetical protein
LVLPVPARTDAAMDPDPWMAETRCSMAGMMLG